MNLIVACDKDYGIGCDNKLPDWRIEESELSKIDMKNFTKLTVGDGNNIVIMGRKTFESLPNGALKNRLNIVISRQFEFNQCTCFDNLLDAFDYSKDYISKSGGKIWVIGGSHIYEESIRLNLVEKVYVTKFKQRYSCDTYLGPLTIEFINNQLN